MRLLHTSDWHIGRTFHGHPTTDHLAIVLDALAAVVREREVDVVLVAGDVFDSATPAGSAFDLLTSTLESLVDVGATVVVTSGNHDSSARLGFQSAFTRRAGVHVLARPERLDEPVLLDDEHGPVAVYGIPYLEPAIVRPLFPGEEVRTQEQAITLAAARIRADLAARDARSVVVSHCFAADVAATAAEGQSPGLERDITAGGIDVVPLAALDGFDYVALGHIHGRSRLAEGVRYSGAPLHYTFSEHAKPRGAWLVDLDADGLRDVEWVDLPVPRRLTVLTGELEELLADPALERHCDDWVSAVLTDQARPVDAMRRLQSRFPHCAHLEHRPPLAADRGAATYAERLHGRDDVDVVGDFLAHVRNGVGPTEAERDAIAEAIAGVAARERSA